MKTNFTFSNDRIGIEHNGQYIDLHNVYLIDNIQFLTNSSFSILVSFIGINEYLDNSYPKHVQLRFDGVIRFKMYGNDVLPLRKAKLGLEEYGFKDRNDQDMDWLMEVISSPNQDIILRLYLDDTERGEEIILRIHANKITCNTRYE